MKDPFKLFQLPQRFAIDVNELKKRYNKIRIAVHPDSVAVYVKKPSDSDYVGPGGKETSS